uniref:LIM zinc-binding domain-containing protein n=1 Tax=Gopherus agassizii TaxID=38772 RepID=A0A452J2G6_9SAUR
QQALGELSLVREAHLPFSLLAGSDSKMREICAGCDMPISDRFLLQVNERSWHEGCVKCAACLQPLSGTCYCRNRQLYCKHDYEK